MLENKIFERIFLECSVVFFIMVILFSVFELIFWVVYRVMRRFLEDGCRLYKCDIEVVLKYCYLVFFLMIVVLFIY